MIVTIRKTMMMINIIINSDLLSCKQYSQVLIINPAQRHKSQKLYKYTKIRKKKKNHCDRKSNIKKY